MNEELNKIDHFKESVVFFKSHQWLYDKPVNEILSKSVLDQFPVDWLQALKNLGNDQLNEFVTRKNVQSDWPASLVDFVKKCRVLNRLPSTTVFSSEIELPKVFKQNLTLKKQHEIFYLSKLVHQQCLTQQVSTIVDLGAGLGYICQLLNHLYHYKVLGLDSRPENVQTSRLRQEKYFPESLSTVKYVCYNIHPTSSQEIIQILQKQLGQEDSICLIGLHACGDLSINMSKIYSELKIAKCLILVSCCYHKMSIKKNKAVHEKKTETVNSIEEKEYFDHFPISTALKEAFNSSNIDVGVYFKRSFMRLACQETSDRWLEMDAKTHDKHTFYVLARAVLELYKSLNHLSLKKVVRKGTRKSQCTSFLSYLEDCKSRYVFETRADQEEISPVEWDDNLKRDLITLWESNQDKRSIIELYTALQLLLQNAAESLILLDRVNFLSECSLDANIFQIADRSTSPRSYAIVSWKK